MATFQSTPARGRRLRYVMEGGTDEQFQSTPARGRRPYRVTHGGPRSFVSIHACAGQATSRSRCKWASEKRCFNPRLRGAGDELRIAGCLAILSVSIHACAGQATTREFLRSSDAMCFNPRLRGAGDRSIVRASVQDQPVSIHACAGQATETVSLTIPLTGGFNPRLRGAGDCDRQRDQTGRRLFQSTPARGRRLQG